MKKIVISALLMGLVATASAQTTLSGTVNYDFTKAQGTSMNSGLADTEIAITATEDIGTGIKVTARLGLDGAGRGEEVSGTDAYVSVDTPMGAVTVGQLEIGNGLKAHTFGMVPVMGADGSVLAGKANLSMAKYTSPAIAGFKASVSATRGVDSTAEHTYVAGVAGAVGPVDAKVDYTNTTKRVRVSGSMDLGVAKVGAGWSGHEEGRDNSWAVAAAVPMGALTVGAVYSNGDGKAKEVGAQYDLSKRTAVQVAYRDISESSSANGSSYRVRLTHNF